MLMDTMWQKSYANPKHRRMLFPEKPSGAGKQLLEFLAKQPGFDKTTTNALDIGCGNGRNAIAIARKGFGNVTGFDVIPEAIEDAKARSADLENIHFFVHDIREPWPFPAGSIDVAFDVNTFSALSPDERDMYTQELSRVLKKDGCYFLTTYTVNDGYYNQFVTRGSSLMYPGVEIYCPDDGIARILYHQEELKEIFHFAFTVLHFSTHTWYGKMFDTYYKREFASLLFQRI